jgi:hypothetical protein
MPGFWFFLTSENCLGLDKTIIQPRMGRVSKKGQVISTFSGTGVLILGDTQSTALNLAGHFSWQTPH